MRIIGWALLAAGLAALAADLAAPGPGGFRLRALGEVWFALHPNSLQVAQPAIERHVAVWLWDPVMLTLLEAPAAALFGGAGLALLAASRLRRRHKRILRKSA